MTFFSLLREFAWSESATVPHQETKKTKKREREEREKKKKEQINVNLIHPQSVNLIEKAKQNTWRTLKREKGGKASGGDDRLGRPP